jgi:hypothetical protein
VRDVVPSVQRTQGRRAWSSSLKTTGIKTSHGLTYAEIISEERGVYCAKCRKVKIGNPTNGHEAPSLTREDKSYVSGYSDVPPPFICSACFRRERR